MNSTDRARCEPLLAELLACRTVTRQPNLALIHAVRDRLAAHGIESVLVHDEGGTKANLYASVGPADQPGVMLSGHTDVVPADGQAWTREPFAFTKEAGRIYGRGSADMKGFVACAVQALIDASSMPLRRPLQLALSYDEEIGCVGVRRLLDVLEAGPHRPFVCVVGEPTLMRMATGHKGKAALRAVCRGQEAHSSLAPTAVNALHLGGDFMAAVRELQARIAAQGRRDEAYDVPYATLHVGRIEGGRALNIVPNSCSLEFEIRHLPGDDVDAWIDELRVRADELAAEARKVSPVAAIEVETTNAYPGLDTPVTHAAVAFLEAFLPPDEGVRKLAFGTEGGLFTRRLEVPVVVCGPGSIEVAHKPDEYVEVAQLQACEAFLARLTRALCD
jgi:acetylornithine deacetylase